MNFGRRGQGVGTGADDVVWEQLPASERMPDGTARSGLSQGVVGEIVRERANALAENDRLREVEATAACVVDIYRGTGGHEGGMRGALADLAEALDAISGVW